MTEQVFRTFSSDLIKELGHLIRDKYVYPVVGEVVATKIQAKMDSGGYDQILDEAGLAVQLTVDLRSLSEDNHWSVMHDPQHGSKKADPVPDNDETRIASYLANARSTNFGFERVARLKGNIGYIDLRRFELSEYGGETAVAAMNFVANCDALIIDLRKNFGGHPSMVQLITSYLVDPEPIHINTFYYRHTDSTQQFWTFPHVPGVRRPDIMVYVLTSNATGSGAEEFAYNLKHMERATLVGEITAGAAHPVTRESLSGGFVVAIPYGRPVNPITQSSWEGTGVTPHIKVPAAKALKTAHTHALETLIAGTQDEYGHFNLEWVGEIVATEYTPLYLSNADLARCAGKYGPRVFTVSDQTLVYENRDLGIQWSIQPITTTRFHLDEDIKFEFILGDSGPADAVVITYRDGRPEVRVPRTT